MNIFSRVALFFKLTLCSLLQVRSSKLINSQLCCIQLKKVIAMKINPLEKSFPTIYSGYSFISMLDHILLPWTDLQVIIGLYQQKMIIHIVTYYHQVSLIHYIYYSSLYVLKIMQGVFRKCVHLCYIFCTVALSILLLKQCLD